MAASVVADLAAEAAEGLEASEVAEALAAAAAGRAGDMTTTRVPCDSRFPILDSR